MVSDILYSSKKWVSQMNNVAYNIDCVEFMRSVPDKHFDLTIADPPYGISITNRHKVGCSAKVVGGGVQAIWRRFAETGQKR